MSLVLKALAVVLLVTYTIAAPVEEQLTVNVEIPAEDDSAPLELPSLETVQDDQLLRTKRQFGLGGERRNVLKDWNCLNIILILF